MRKLFFTLTAIILFCCQISPAQTATQTSPTGRFTVGERLTYNISFATYQSAAFAETYVISSGKYNERDAVYLQGKFKTTEFVSAAFFTVDQTRQILVDPNSGLPMLSKVIFDENGMPREKVTDHKGTAPNHDWLSAIYQLRFSNAQSGVLTIQEDNNISQLAYQVTGKAHDKTSAGEFDCIVMTVDNPTFPKMQIHLSDDERRIPVVITYKHPKGAVKVTLASIQDLAPEPVAENTPKPQNTPPVIAPTPRPRPTPAPYRNNQPLADDLPFNLGETLTYRLSRPSGGNSMGTLVVQAKERKQYFGRDSLLLSATVEQLTDPAFFSAGDSIKSFVEPDTLLPQRTEVNFRGALSLFNQTLQFVQETGKVTDSKGVLYDVPVGTHDILSLAYAIRAFNLKDVKPNKGPNGDIRVALFTTDGPVILTIISQPEEIIDFQGKKHSAQVIYANIGQSSAKLWLSKDAERLPLRMVVTSPTFSFEANLISVMQNTPPVEEVPAAAGAYITTGVPQNVPPNTNFNNPIADPNFKPTFVNPTTLNPTVVNPTLGNPAKADSTVNPEPSPTIKKP